MEGRKSGEKMRCKWRESSTSLNLGHRMKGTGEIGRKFRRKVWKTWLEKKGRNDGARKFGIKIAKSNWGEGEERMTGNGNNIWKDNGEEQ